MPRVAAFQAPCAWQYDIEAAVGAIRDAVVCCEGEAVEILCCPEGMLGGLADDVRDPRSIAIDVARGELRRFLSPIGSRAMAVIIGFTEVGSDAKLYNSAAVWLDGRVAGLYRKLHPTIDRSVYAAGRELPLFRVKGFEFGIQICNDTNIPEHAAELARRGARAVFVPSNNTLPHAKADVVSITEDVDRSLALENAVHIIRADFAGEGNGLTSLGTSKIVNASGHVIAQAPRLESCCIYGDIDVDL